MSSLRSILARHPFPLILFAAGRFVITRLSIAWGTFRARCLLALLGCPCGPGLKVDGRLWVRIRQKGAVTVGRGVLVISRFGSNLVGLTGPTVLECIGDGRIFIADGVGMSGAVISSRAEVRIGRRTMLGGNVRIYDHDFHSMDPAVRADRLRAPARAARVRVWARAVGRIKV